MYLRAIPLPAIIPPDNLASKHPKVDATTFIAVAWAGTGLAFLFLLFRLFVRLRSFGRIYADDVIVVVGWICLLVITIIWQVKHGWLYALYGLTAGKEAATEDLFRGLDGLQRIQIPVLVLFYTGLWSVSSQLFPTCVILQYGKKKAHELFTIFSATFEYVAIC